MIPQQSPSRFTTENGVRYRIAACRQRLRNSRITHRATDNSQIDYPAESTGSVADTAVSAEERLPAASAIATPFGATAPQLMPATEELEEVGIT
ncbi:MAG TPA: hypothetical protein VIV66_10605 [Pyrinomonadaceae bacterium]